MKSIVLSPTKNIKKLLLTFRLSLSAKRLFQNEIIKLVQEEKTNKQIRVCKMGGTALLIDIY